MIFNHYLTLVHFKCSVNYLYKFNKYTKNINVKRSCGI